jgi:outer membrane protein TolC
MVEKLGLWFLLFITCTASAAPLPLTPKDVAELILKQSYRATEVNLQAQQAQFQLAEAQSNFDFQLNADYGFQDSQFQSLTQTYFVRDKSYITNIKLAKPFMTGTTLGVEYSSTSSSPEYSLTAPTPATNSTTSVVGLTIEQNLLQNFFGAANRAEVRAAETSVQAAGISRVSNLQDLVLEGIQAYWSAFVAQATFQEAVNSRNRYQKLVASVKKKSGYGYTNPGESSQAQAELESREQNVKAQSVNYLATLDRLLTLLRLPPQSEIQFVVKEDIPLPPQTPKVEVEELRPVKASKLSLQSAQELLTSAKSNSLPDVSLVGKYYSQGLEQTSDEAYNEMLSREHPRYYVGVKLQYNFGSGYQDQDILNRRVTRDLAETRLQRQRLELQDRGSDIQRRIQSTYAIAQSAKVQRTLREKTVQELTRSYNQGRTDIAILIDALNKLFDSEVQVTRAIGDYQIALNQWSAFKDELIPESQN